MTSLLPLEDDSQGRVERMRRSAVILGLVAASVAPVNSFLAPPPLAASAAASQRLPLVWPAGAGWRSPHSPSTLLLAVENSRRQSSSRLVLASTSTNGVKSKVEEAIEKCRDAVKRKPENEEAWFFLGVLLQETGQLDEAQAAFEASTKLDPQREAGWLNLGLLAECREDAPSALQAYMSALKANPSSGAAYVRLGAVMESGTKPDAAQAAYEKAVSLDSGDIAAHTALCKLLLRLDRPDSARQAAQRAVEAVPQASAAYIELGAAMNALARPREAEKALRTAVSIDSSNSEAYNNLGVALKAQGKYPEAEAAYKTAVELAPDLFEPLFNLGIFYREQGALYHEAAKAMLLRALEMDPTNMDVRLVLATLEGGNTELELPRPYVEKLFTSVAETYEENIIPAISYQVPNELVTAVSKSLAQDCGCASAQLPANEWAVLDVGCGTGLSAAALRGTAMVMAGCDVSQGMCAVARRKGLYVTVAQEDAATFLLQQPPNAADLVIAGDVFPYIKDLQPVLAAGLHVLKPGARFTFSTEEDIRAGSDSDKEGGAQDLRPVLNPKARFWHSEAYVRKVAGELGYSVVVADHVKLHKQARDSKVVMGAVYVLQAPF